MHLCGMAGWPKWFKMIVVCALCIAFATAVAFLLEALDLTP